MREILNNFEMDGVYVFRKNYTTYTSKMYDLIDGSRVDVRNETEGVISKNGITFMVTPGFCEKIK